MKIILHAPASPASIWHQFFPLLLPVVVALITWIGNRVWRRAVVKTALITQVNSLEETLIAELEYISSGPGSNFTWFPALPYISSDIVNLAANGDISKTQAHYMTDLHLSYRAMISRMSEYARVVITDAQIDTLLVVNIADDEQAYRDSIEMMIAKIQTAKPFLNRQSGPFSWGKWLVRLTSRSADLRSG